MSSVQFARRFLPVLALALVATALTGCACTGMSTGAGPIPMDLPLDPDPTKKYCKVWVPPVYRDVPYLVQCCPGGTREVPQTVMETRAYDEVVQKPYCKTVRGCGTSCEESLVQVRPGGYRWETDGTCWKYVERCPEYKWCNRVTHEDSIDYCMDVPAEYKTTVETVPVERTRTEYYPGKYEVRTRQEVFVPGHWEWRSTCADGCTPDRRPVRTHLVERKCQSDCKPAVLDQDCSRSN